MTAYKQPLRQCVACREMKAKKDLIRIVKTPEGNVVCDRKGKTNGRGAYVCNTSECLEKAFRSKALERSLKMKISEDIYSSLREELTDLDR